MKKNRNYRADYDAAISQIKVIRERVIKSITLTIISHVRMIDKFSSEVRLVDIDGDSSSYSCSGNIQGIQIKDLKPQFFTGRTNVEGNKIYWDLDDFNTESLIALEESLTEWVSNMTYKAKKSNPITEDEKVIYMLACLNSIREGRYEMEPKTYDGVVYLHFKKANSRLERIINELMATPPAPDRKYFDLLSKNGYKLHAGERDSFGWLTGCIDIPGKGTICFG